MEILRHLKSQMETTRLPLFAITVAAVPCPNTPVILTLHWHAFVRERRASEEAEPLKLTPVPSSALQINESWSDFTELDQATIEAGWQLGAWDVARTERPGVARAGADAREAWECLQTFGAFPFGVEGHPVVVADAPDTDELLQVAARRGYLMWMFRPVLGGIWKSVSQDPTLEADGGRRPPCPIPSIPAQWATSRKTVYRFGVSVLHSA